MNQHERDALIDPESTSGDRSPRQPSRRRLLWLGAASSLVGASLSGLAGYRLVAAQRTSDRDDDDLDDDVDLDDDDLQNDRDDDDLDNDVDLDDDDLHDDHDDDDDDDSGRGRGRGGRDDDDRNAVRDATQLDAEIPAGSVLVEIFNDDDFTPASITIDAGQTVTFVNYDGDDHTATGSGFDTGIIRERGGVASVTLDTPGRYPFACQIHPEMVGEVLVRDENGNVPPRAAASPVAEDAVPVRIVNLDFDPARVTVGAGGTVTWSNDDTVPHTVTAEDGSFDSGILDPGARFSWTFDQAGTVAYQCSLHPEMRGEVEVSGDGPVQRFDGAAGTPSASSGSASPSDAGASAGTEVAIVDLAYEPPVVTIPAGSEVTWTNDGQLPHTVTSDGFDSGVLQPGQTFRQVFADPGTFDYACAIHPGMTGQVVVESA